VTGRLCWTCKAEENEAGLILCDDSISRQTLPWMLQSNCGKRQPKYAWKRNLWKEMLTAGVIY